ncbi:hypothetical protein [Scytonema hofmannii]|uniref:hypothetical protein n=1 Tax=Scytonema hofmannii TaxID=34078 RepID=UPI0011DF3112|nr:hypothetical protein [Scytonema hofmannii]
MTDILVVEANECPKCKHTALNHGSPFSPKALPGCVTVRCSACLWRGARKIYDSKRGWLM